MNNKKIYGIIYSRVKRKYPHYSMEFWHNMTRYLLKR